VQGLDVAGSLLSAASGSAFLSGDIASALLCAVGALLIFVSYVIITINLVVTLVESYLVVSAGYIFLGFGGSRWTAPYTERYIGLAVSIGIKLLVLYCVIAAGQSLGAGWNAEASGIGTSTTPAKTALDVIGGALIYMMCCWQIPKLFGAVIGGSPALTGGDLVMAGTAVAGGALAAASLGTGAVAGVAGALGTSSAANAAGSTGSSVASAVSNVGSASAASGNSSAGASSLAGSSVNPPMSSGSKSGVQSSVNGVGKASSLDEVGGQPLAGSGFECRFQSLQQSRNRVFRRKMNPYTTPIWPHGGNGTNAMATRSRALATGGSSRFCAHCLHWSLPLG
jgi:type IV secretion system protein TrbL